MYAYEYDPSTGGYILLSTLSQFSKEPRPVYYRELDAMGFDRYWRYEKNDSAPYMWAEANNYFYRGRLVAKSKGGSIYAAPEITILEEPEPNNAVLRMVDLQAMVERNKAILSTLVQSTIRSIYNAFQEYKKKIDVFYVAFSGGKDSVVLLDLVKRVLPHNQFKVLFGDTGMEFPDTYTAVDTIEKLCNEEGIEFIRAESPYNPLDTWRQFGPPATTIRWCCSVHKTSPQIIALRSILGKSDFTGMAFVGVRGDESLARSGYSFISYGEKHKGQYSCNPILEWGSAELFLYIYEQGLFINETYKKGNRRAGCLVCPRAAERNEWMTYTLYPDAVDDYIGVIREMYSEAYPDNDRMREFIGNGGWKARKNGRDLSLQSNYKESLNKDMDLIIHIDHPRTEWREWIKTIGILQSETSPYDLLYRGKHVWFELEESSTAIDVKIPEESLKIDTTFSKLIKGVFRKTASCITCLECVADCHNGCLQMVNGQVLISDSCKHCSQCHKAEKGCLLYKSIAEPKGGTSRMQNASINTYSHHAPKMEWIEQFFEYKDSFSENNSLGTQMIKFFKVFQRHAGLTEDGHFSRTAEVIDRLGLSDERSWGIMLTNLAYTPQIHWFVTNVGFDREFDRSTLENMMLNYGANSTIVGDVSSSLGRFTELPFSKIGIGSSQKEKRKIKSFMRSAWDSPDPKVILYALYRFAEECDGYYRFTLSSIVDDTIERVGVTPKEIFGIDRITLEAVLRNLSANYPDYIKVAFTHDLDNINLNEEKTSKDVLELF